MNDIIISPHVQKMIARVEAGHYNKSQLFSLIKNAEENRGKYGDSDVDALVDAASTKYLKLR